MLLIQQGGRKIVRLDAQLKPSPLLDRYQGKKLNSPNDLVFAPDGSLWFTDPPFGLSGMDKDPAKELPFNAVYHHAGGKLEGEDQGPVAAERPRLLTRRQDTVRRELRAGAIRQRVRCRHRRYHRQRSRADQIWSR